jgi:hypothetical protein
MKSPVLLVKGAFAGLALAILMMALLLIPHISAAQGISLSSSVQISYPSSINFKISAQSNTDITSLRLHYIVAYQNYANVISEGWAQFTSAKSVDTQWLWDMRRTGSLPPGTKIDYWWTALDTAGSTSETDHTSITFDDNTHTWKTMTSGPVILLWYNGNQDFANSLMAAAQDGIAKIGNDLGLKAEGKVKLYIYGSVQDMQASRLFPQQWEAGVTYGGYNTIVLGVAPSDLAFGEGAIPHELTHWLTGNFTFNDYGAGIPVWLSEGMATYIQNEPDSSWLDLAIQQNMLISVRTLSSPFSAVSQQAYISYAESHSIVSYLLQTYGKDKIYQLLGVFGQGSDYDSALKQVYGFDQDGLNNLWLRSIGVKTSALFPWTESVKEGIA